MRGLHIRKACRPVRAAELDMLELEAPEVDADLRSYQAEAGCTEFLVRRGGTRIQSTASKRALH